MEGHLVHRGMMAKLGRALLVAAIAVVAWSLYFAARSDLWWVLVLAVPAALIVSVTPMRIAPAVVRGRPSLAVWLIEAGGTATIVVIGGAVTVGLAALGGYLESLIEIKDDAVSSAVAKTVGGAVGAVGAALLLEDIEKGTGSFWPSARTRKLFGRTFSFSSESAGFDAVWEERVVRTVNGIQYDIEGWGLRARLARAKIIAAQP